MWGVKWLWCRIVAGWVLWLWRLRVAVGVSVEVFLWKSFGQGVGFVVSGENLSQVELCVVQLSRLEVLEVDVCASFGVAFV